jgi:hypothetical protein
MKNKKRSLRLALFLSLSGFIALVFITSQHNGYQEPSSSALITYGLDVELKWVAEDEHADFALVQDTLGYYAASFGIHGDALSSRFELDHCCDDPALRAAFERNADFYRFSFSADFAQPASRQLLLNHVVDAGYLLPGKIHQYYGMLRGNANLSLPIPSRP